MQANKSSDPECSLCGLTSLMGDIRICHACGQKVCTWHSTSLEVFHDDRSVPYREKWFFCHSCGKPKIALALDALKASFRKPWEEGAL
ncbi:MAG: hypothetical protein Q8R28_11490 [Dehalococcoidia bacterium]|nr:hypothetical protein [Dehalococcoidia bacterium]